ncbi:streptococcal hemagglutinin-like isoform X2 [Littorina saxatilis]|uniref:streptococcal hemagglutinin-like isoform X2 n=1 Tax=Littorina saxatilis TaxID=31220 RepID=UPI0038B4D028
MAEANKSGILAKAQKRLSRTKTKVLQTLGKADRSTDETFDDLIQKTERQHDVAHNLQKEFKTYFHCMRALSHSSKSLAITLGQNYEEEWTDSYGFRASLTTQDLLWSDYLETVQTSVMEALNTYIASFPALKAKIAKRGRKMVDYDNSRHNLEVLQAAKKKDDAKIAKAQEDLNESKRIFEELHNELCSELPGFYNSRVTFYADLFQKHFGCENTLHTEIARISQSLTDTADQLSKEYVQFVYTPKRPLSKSPSDNVLRTENSTFYLPGSEEQHVNGESSPRGGTDSPASSASPAATPTTPSSVARPTDSAAAETAATAASVSASAAAADAEDDSDGADHLYGNQDSIMAAAKVNGDTDKPKEILEEEEELYASAEIAAATFASVTLRDNSAPLDDYATVSLDKNSHLVSDSSHTAPITPDSHTLPEYCTPVPATAVAQSLSKPCPSTLAHEPLSRNTDEDSTSFKNYPGIAPKYQKKEVESLSGNALQSSTGNIDESGQEEDGLKIMEKSIDSCLEITEEQNEKFINEKLNTKASQDKDPSAHLSASSVNSGLFLDSSYQQEIDAALREGTAASEDCLLENRQRALPCSPQTSESDDEEDFEEALLFVDEKPPAPEASQSGFETDPAESLCSVVDPAICGAASSETRPTSNISEFETLSTSDVTQHGNKSFGEPVPSSDMSDLDSFIDASGRTQTDKERPDENVGDGKHACATSDLDTLRGAHSNKEGSIEERVKKTAQVVTTASSLHPQGDCPVKSTEEEAQDRELIVESSQIVEGNTEVAGSGTHVTGWFSDFSRTHASPTGEVYENITFSSQEDLAERDRSQDSLRPSSLSQSLGTSLESCGSIPAEEKSIISALEKAILEETDEVTESKDQSRSSLEVQQSREEDQPDISFGERSISQSSDLMQPTTDLVPKAGPDKSSQTQVPEQQKAQQHDNSYKVTAGEESHGKRADGHKPSEAKGNEENVERKGHKREKSTTSKRQGDNTTEGPDCQNPPTTSSNTSTASKDSERRPPKHRGGARIVEKPPLPPPAKDSLRNLPAYLATPHWLQPGEKELTAENPQESQGSSEKNKKGSLTHRGIKMFKSMLHISSRGKEFGEKTTTAKTARSVDLGSPQEAHQDSRGSSEEPKKRRRSASRNGPSAADGAKGSKRKSSPTSHTHSPTPANKKKEKKSADLPEIGDHKKRSCTLPAASDSMNKAKSHSLPRTYDSSGKEKSEPKPQANAKKEKLQTQPETRDSLRKKKSDGPSVTEDEQNKDPSDTEKKDQETRTKDKKSKTGPKQEDEPKSMKEPQKTLSSSDNRGGVSSQAAGDVKGATKTGSSVPSINQKGGGTSEGVRSSERPAGDHTTGTHRRSGGDQAGGQQSPAALQAFLRVEELKDVSQEDVMKWPQEPSFTKTLAASSVGKSSKEPLATKPVDSGPDMPAPPAENSLQGPSIDSDISQTPNKPNTVSTTADSVITKVSTDSSMIREPNAAQPSQSRTSSKSLNPLAPPFTMPSAPASARPALDPCASIGNLPQLSASVSDPSQVRLTLPYTQVEASAEMSSACGDQQQHFLSLPYTMVTSSQDRASQGEGPGLPAGSSSAITRMSMVTTAVRNSLSGRHPHTTSMQSNPQGNFLREPVSQHPARASFPESVYLQTPYRHIQADFQGAGPQHGGDVTMGTQSMLMSSVQGNLKEGIGSQGLAQKTMMGVCRERDKASGNGAGDVVTQVAPPGETKELILVENPTVIENQKTCSMPQVVHASETSASSKVASKPRAVSSTDLAKAREAWKSAWSNVAGTKSSESTLAENARQPAATSHSPGISLEPGVLLNGAGETPQNNVQAAEDLAAADCVYENIPLRLCGDIHSKLSAEEKTKEDEEKVTEGEEEEAVYINMQGHNVVRKNASYVDMQEVQKTLTCQASAVEDLSASSEAQQEEDATDKTYFAAAEELETVRDDTLKSYQISDGFETVRDDVPPNAEVSDEFEVPTNVVPDSCQVSDESKTLMEGSSTDIQKEECDTYCVASNTVTVSVEIDQQSSNQPEAATFSQEKENSVESATITCTLSVTETQVSQSSNTVITSTSVSQVFQQVLTAGETNTTSQTVDSYSTDPFACDSAISAHSDNTSHIHEELSGSTEVIITACDSGISTSEISHSTTDVNHNVELNQSVSSLVNQLVEDVHSLTEASFSPHVAEPSPAVVDTPELDHDVTASQSFIACHSPEMLLQFSNSLNNQSQEKTQGEDAEALLSSQRESEEVTVTALKDEDAEALLSSQRESEEVTVTALKDEEKTVTEHTGMEEISEKQETREGEMVAPVDIEEKKGVELGVVESTEADQELQSRTAEKQMSLKVKNTEEKDVRSKTEERRDIDKSVQEQSSLEKTVVGQEVREKRAEEQRIMKETAGEQGDEIVKEKKDKEHGIAEDIDSEEKDVTATTSEHEETDTRVASEEGTEKTDKENKDEVLSVVEHGTPKETTEQQDIFENIDDKLDVKKGRENTDVDEHDASKTDLEKADETASKQKSVKNITVELEAEKSIGEDDKIAENADDEEKDVGMLVLEGGDVDKAVQEPGESKKTAEEQEVMNKAVAEQEAEADIFVAQEDSEKMVTGQEGKSGEEVNVTEKWIIGEQSLDEETKARDDLGSTTEKQEDVQEQENFKTFGEERDEGKTSGEQGDAEKNVVKQKNMEEMFLEQRELEKTKREHEVIDCQDDAATYADSSEVVQSQVPSVMDHHEDSSIMDPDTSPLHPQVSLDNFVTDAGELFPSVKDNVELAVSTTTQDFCGVSVGDSKKEGKEISEETMKKDHHMASNKSPESSETEGSQGLFVVMDCITKTVCPTAQNTSSPVGHSVKNVIPLDDTKQEISLETSVREGSHVFSSVMEYAEHTIDAAFKNFYTSSSGQFGDSSVGESGEGCRKDDDGEQEGDGDTLDATSKGDTNASGILLCDEKDKTEEKNEITDSQHQRPDATAPEAEAIPEDVQEEYGNFFKNATEGNTNASATVDTKEKVWGTTREATTWERDASDHEGSEGFEVTSDAEEMTKDVSTGSLEVLHEAGLFCGASAPRQNAMDYFRNDAEMNALSSDSRKESTDAAPVTNNVYEQPQGNGEEDSDDEDDMYQSPPSNKPAYEAPPNTLFRVEATHTYNGEDIDELTFEPGDIIYVVPFDNEEEQDDGWQLGIKEKDGMKGVFPENFTKRI